MSSSSSPARRGRGGGGGGGGGSNATAAAGGSGGGLKERLAAAFGSIGNIVLATAELLQDQELRRRGADLVVSEAQRGLNEAQRSLEAGARARLGGVLRNVERQIQAFQREQRARDAAAELERHARLPVDVQIGDAAFEDMPQEIRSRLWWTLLERPELGDAVVRYAHRLRDGAAGAGGGGGSRSRGGSRSCAGGEGGDEDAGGGSLVEPLPSVCASTDGGAGAGAVAGSGSGGAARSRACSPSPFAAATAAAAAAAAAATVGEGSAAVGAAAGDGGGGGGANDGPGLEGSGVESPFASQQQSAEVGAPVPAGGDAGGSSNTEAAATGAAGTAAAAIAPNPWTAAAAAAAAAAAVQEDARGGVGSSGSGAVAAADSGWELVDRSVPSALAGGSGELQGIESLRSLVAALANEDSLTAGRGAQQALFRAMIEAPWQPNHGLPRDYAKDCEYARLLRAPLPRHVADAIARDAPRTFPEHPLFSGGGADGGGGADACAGDGAGGSAGGNNSNSTSGNGGGNGGSGGGGQDALARVLRAYAALDPEVGYCQGMAFAAGVLLVYLPEEAAFRALKRLLLPRTRGEWQQQQQPQPQQQQQQDPQQQQQQDPQSVAGGGTDGDGAAAEDGGTDEQPGGGCGLRRLYRPGLDQLKLELSRLELLLATHEPLLHAHLIDQGLPALLYAAQWYMTTFSCPFPHHVAARVLDALLLTRDDALLPRLALAVMQQLRDKLLALDDFEELMTAVKVTPLAWPLHTFRRVFASAMLDSPVSRRELDAAATAAAGEFRRLGRLASFACRRLQRQETPGGSVTHYALAEGAFGPRTETGAAAAAAAPVPSSREAAGVGDAARRVEGGGGGGGGATEPAAAAAAAGEQAGTSSAAAASSASASAAGATAAAADAADAADDDFRAFANEGAFEELLLRDASMLNVVDDDATIDGGGGGGGGGGFARARAGRGGGDARE